MTRLLPLLTVLCALAVAQPAAAAESFDLFPSSSATGQRHTLAKPLEEGKKYTITISGTIHNESTLDTGLSRDFDALWKYDCRRTDEDGGPGPNLCSPEVWPGVQIGQRDQPARDYPSYSTTGQTVAERPPLNEAHSYSLLIDKVPAAGITYLRAYGSFDDPDWTYSGSLHVTIEGPDAGELLAASRYVKVQAAGKPWRPAKVGQALEVGDGIHTGFKSTARFRHPTGAIVTMKPMSLVKIEKGGIVLVDGEVETQVGRKGRGASDFEIRTPATTASVRGTVFSVLYDLVAKLSVVSVREGVVAVTPEDPSLTPVELTKGQEVEVSKKSVSPVSAIGQAGRPAGGLTRRQVYAAITKLLFKATKGCRLNSASEKGSVSAKRTAKGWAASARVAGKRSGVAKWTVTGKKIRPGNRFAKQIARRCR